MKINKFAIFLSPLLAIGCQHNNYTPKFSPPNFKAETDTSICSIISAGEQVAQQNNYRIQVGKMPITGINSEYPTLTAAGLAIRKLKAGGICEKSLDCDVVGASGSDSFLHLMIGDLLTAGSNGSYADLESAQSELAALQGDGVCK